MTDDSKPAYADMRRGRIDKVLRRPSTANGNPMFRIVLKDGRSWKTWPDANFALGIVESHWEGGEFVFGIDQNAIRAATRVTDGEYGAQVEPWQSGQPYVLSCPACRAYLKAGTTFFPPHRMKRTCNQPADRRQPHCTCDACF